MNEGFVECEFIGTAGPRSSLALSDKAHSAAKPGSLGHRRDRFRDRLTRRVLHPFWCPVLGQRPTAARRFDVSRFLTEPPGQEPGVGTG